MAQGLDVKETLEQVVVPEQQAAFRQSILPDFKPYQGQGATISYTEYSYPSAITRTVAFSEPIPWSGSTPVTPYRGYARLGYFPSLNLDANIGYRLVSNSKTQVGLWAQYNALRYTHTADDDQKTTYKQNAFTGELSAVHHFSDVSTLKADLNYTFANSALPFAEKDNMLGTNNFNLTVGWESQYKAFGYFVKGRLGVFSFGKDILDFFNDKTLFENDESLQAINQKQVNFTAGVSLTTSEHSRLGIDVDADFLSNNHWNTPGKVSHIITSPEEIYVYDLYGIRGEGSKTLGVLSANPYYCYSGTNFTTRIGALVQGSIHCGKALHIAPQFLINYTPTQLISVYGKVSGGEHLNPLSQMYQVTYGYLLPNLTYQASHIPFTLTGGVTIGRWNGLSAGVEFNYAKANDWYMFDSQFSNLPIPTAVDLSGFMAGLNVGYDYENAFSLKASVQAAPQKYNRGWYLWRDRAKMVADIELTVRPIKALEVNLRYDFRGKRCCYRLYTESDGTIFDREQINLGSWKDLSIGATYAITDASRDISLGGFKAPAISIFARIDNLLSKHPYLLYNVHAQGFHGLVGVNVKF